MSGKPKGGSRKKSSTQKYRKRRKKERENRATKQEAEIKRQVDRIHEEAEFAQRIRKEPSLKEVIESGRVPVQD